MREVNKMDCKETVKYSQNKQREENIYRNVKEQNNEIEGKHDYKPVDI